MEEQASKPEEEQEEQHLRKVESWAYATAFFVIFESSKHVTGLGVLRGIPCSNIRLCKYENDDAYIPLAALLRYLRA